MKQSIGISNLVAMKDHPRYVVASSTDNGPMSVWNVAKGKTSGRAVRIEHGLVDATDIVVLRNTKAVILGMYVQLLVAMSLTLYNNHSSHMLATILILMWWFGVIGSLFAQLLN